MKFPVISSKGKRVIGYEGMFCPMCHAYLSSEVGFCRKCKVEINWQTFPVCPVCDEPIIDGVPHCINGGTYGELSVGESMLLRELPGQSARFGISTIPEIESGREVGCCEPVAEGSQQ